MRFEQDDGNVVRGITPLGCRVGQAVRERVKIDSLTVREVNRRLSLPESEALRWGRLTIRYRGSMSCPLPPSG
jgi:hypothetical protein